MLGSKLIRASADTILHEILRSTAALYVLLIKMSQWLKVRLHGRRQAARLARDMLQRDNSVYMVGSCRARLLHINHVSAVSEVGVLQRKCSRQPVPRGNYKFKLKIAARARSSRASAASSVSPCKRSCCIPMLCFYFAARLSRRSRAACRVPCKRSLSDLVKCFNWITLKNNQMSQSSNDITTLG